MVEYLIVSMAIALVTWLAIFGLPSGDGRPQYALDSDAEGFYVNTGQDPITPFEGIHKRETEGVAQNAVQLVPSLMQGVEEHRKNFQEKLSKPAY